MRADPSSLEVDDQVECGGWQHPHTLLKHKINNIWEIYLDNISGILFMIRHTISISANQNEYKQIGWLLRKEI